MVMAAPRGDHRGYRERAECTLVSGEVTAGAAVFAADQQLVAAVIVVASTSEQAVLAGPVAVALAWRNTMAKPAYHLTRGGRLIR